MLDRLSLPDIQAAAARISGGVVYTDFTLSEAFSSQTGAQVFLKHEQRQHTGSFKERGARNALLQLPDAQKKTGVIAASAGNHALALARHGQLLGIPVTVVMPSFAPMMKVARCREAGARVILHGAHLLEAKAQAQVLVERENLRYINGYDDLEIIAGAGTLGLEMFESVPDLDVLVVPVGGGGLIAGIAVAAKAIKPGIRIVGVEPERAASWTAAQKAGAPVAAEMLPTLADGLAVSVVGANAFAIGRERVDEVVLVDEHDLALAILRLVEMEKAVVEGAGAAGVAALLAGKIGGLQGKKVGTVLAGGNIDSTMLGRIIQRGLAVDGRLCRFSAHISDRPGGLAAFSKVLAEEGVSVVDITHDRIFGGDEIAKVSVLCTVETRDLAQVAALAARLEREGFAAVFHTTPR